MPYTSLENLPEQIRRVLPEKAQRLFMEKFNEAVRDEDTDTSRGQAMRIAWEAIKEEGFGKGELSGMWIKGLQNEENQISGMFKFDEGDVNEVQILRTGEWEHPQYGDITITEQDIDLFIKSFEERARRIDLAIDQAHEPDKGAAGWIEGLHKRQENGSVGLYAEVDWTDFGRELIDDKRFKYISPEFRFNYEDDETGELYENVLFGAGLTNRPFIKDMEPIMMSEDVIEDIQKQAIKQKGDAGMQDDCVDALKFLAEKTGKTEEQVKELMEFIEDNEIGGVEDLKEFQWREMPVGWDVSAVRHFYDSLGGYQGCVNEMSGRIDEPEGFCGQLAHMVAGRVEMTEDEDEVDNKKGGNSDMELEEVKNALGLAEEAGEEEVVNALEDFSKLYDKLELSEEAGASEALQKIDELSTKAEKAVELDEENTQLSERVASIEQEMLEEKWENIKSKAMSEGRMTAEQAEVFKERYLENPEATKEIINTLKPVVEMGEKGSSQDGGSQGRSAINSFRSKVKELQSEQGMEYSEAMKEVKKDNPQLWEEVQQERG